MKIKESESGKEKQGSRWMYRSASVAAAIAGAAALEVLYGCAGESSVEDLIEENVGEVSEAVNEYSEPSSSPCAGVVCPGADQCHDAGSCSPSSGACSSAVAKANGTGCNDGDPTTLSDMCVNGVCKGNTGPGVSSPGTNPPALPSGTPVPASLPATCPGMRLSNAGSVPAGSTLWAGWQYIKAGQRHYAQIAGTQKHSDLIVVFQDGSNPKVPQDQLHSSEPGAADYARNLPGTPGTSMEVQDWQPDHDGWYNVGAYAKEGPDYVRITSDVSDWSLCGGDMHIDYCNGAVGSNCTGNGPGMSCSLTSNAMMNCWASVGSQWHDTCCAHNGHGDHCGWGGNPSNWPSDCSNEWNKATTDSLSKHQVLHDFDPTAPAYAGYSDLANGTLPTANSIKLSGGVGIYKPDADSGWCWGTYWSYWINAFNEAFCEGGPSQTGSSPGVAAAAQCGPSSGKEYLATKSDGWGDNNFGSGYNAQAGVGSTASTAYDVWLGAKGDAHATLFGTTMKILDMGAQATSKNGVRASRGWLEVVGLTLYDQSLAVSMNFHPSVTFFKVGANFWGVNVSAEAAGSVGVTASAFLPGSLSVKATPAAQAWVAASGSVGGWCLSAGVSGSLTLLKIDVPTNVTAQFEGNGIGVYATSNLAIQSLSGRISLDFNYCLGSWHPEIASWSGFSTTYPIVSASYCM